MINVVLLGTGNVATHLFKAFSATNEVTVKQIYNHSEPSLLPFQDHTSITTSLEELAEADLYLLALKDDALPATAKKLKEQRGLIAHTSGSTSIDVLKDSKRRGVFYPLQTFSKDQPLKYGDIPFCLEAKEPEDFRLLSMLAQKVSGKSYKVSSAQRKKLHLSAVFVCNFVNHLYTIGENICRENDLPFEILQPLIMETAEKVTRSSPRGVQTGPAKRGDQSTIDAHLELLNSGENKEIYQLLTKAIKKFHGKKL